MEEAKQLSGEDPMIKSGHDSGAINLAKQAPVSGSYSGIDALGLFWSMQDTKEVKNDATLKETFERSIELFIGTWAASIAVSQIHADLG